MNTKFWVDPPSGWRYGFPKVYDAIHDNANIFEWIIEQGYPRKEAESYGKHFNYRMWEVT